MKELVMVKIRHAGVLVALVGFLLLGPTRTHAAPDVDLSGGWVLDGANGAGHYTGTGSVERGSSGGWVMYLRLSYDSGDTGTARFEGTLDGNTLSGDRLRTTGMAGAISGEKRSPVHAVYVLSDDGRTLTGKYGRYHETLTHSAPARAHILVDADRDGRLTPADADAAAAGKKAMLTFVPGGHANVFAPASVTVDEGTVTLEMSPADAIKVTEDGQAVGTLAQGTHDLRLEAVRAGDVELRLTSGSTVVASATVTIEHERLYLIMSAYLGEEVSYQESDITKVKDHLLPTLRAAGFTVIEDGKGMDQSVIDKGLTDPRNPKKVIVDWCTTTDDFAKYFNRQTVKGFFWSSHGFMEPFPGCPDAELGTLESREWTAVAGDPSQTGDRHFVREWRGMLEANAYKLDFGVLHACCTGGIGDYANQPWEYCGADTQARAKDYFKGTLPDASALKYVTHDSTSSHYGFLQTFDGSSYFGLYDVKWDQIAGALAP
jgi:hypothetical protein